MEYHVDYHAWRASADAREHEYNHRDLQQVAGYTNGIAE